VWEIPREKFAQFASHRPYVLNEIVALMATEIADAHDKMFSLAAVQRKRSLSCS
jgi:CRP/FNR family transcriptional regulator